MRRRTRHRPPAPANHERWLITYADLITLLMIFFVILYAMSKLDASKYDTLSQALQQEFREGRSFVPKGSVLPSQPIGSNDAILPQIVEELPVDMQERRLQQTMEIILGYIDEQQLNDHISIRDTPRGIAITLHDLLLFDLGKAELKQDALPVLDRLANLFGPLQTKVSVEGHTDDLPLTTGAYYVDNWGLSQARSVAVIRYLTQEAKLPAHLFRSAAYADTEPVAPNDSEANRQKNRRVEIVLLRDE